MMTRPGKRFYSFDVFRVDPVERLLFRKDREIPLTPKVFDTLIVLLENSSHVLTKQELMQQVWPDSFVEENNLAQNISILRKALGEQYIQTVPKRGYRFVGDVKLQEDETVIIRERMRGRIVVEKTDQPDFADIPKPIPETMYTRSGDVNIAYQVVGDAPLDLVFVMGWVSHLEYCWREPSFARFLLRLASFSRLILFDRRGTGLSDRVPIKQLPTLEQRMDDARAVVRCFRRWSNVQSVCRDLSREDARSRDDRYLRQTHSRCRLSMGTNTRTARTVFRSHATAVGWTSRHRRTRADRGARSEVSRMVGGVLTHGCESGSGRGVDADERRDRCA